MDRHMTSPLLYRRERRRWFSRKQRYHRKFNAEMSLARGQGTLLATTLVVSADGANRRHNGNTAEHAG
jgi:hypothetical protein